MKNKTMASGVVAPEILRCGLAAEVAVYARYVHVKEAGRVFRYFFSSVGHCAFFLVSRWLAVKAFEIGKRDPLRRF